MKRGLLMITLVLALGGCEPSASPTPVVPTLTVSPPSPTFTVAPTVRPTRTPKPTRSVLRTAAPPPTNTSRELRSIEVGDRYKIYVSLPGGYDADARPGYHVVYLLDGDWYFDGADLWMTKGGVTKIVADLRSLGVMPPVIVVGIGYVGDNKRERDFYEEPDGFYAFIQSELVPLIDDEYDTVSSPGGRTLVGHSLGGYFVLHTLLRQVQDSLFREYIAVSGDYTSYERKLFAAEQDLYDRVGGDALSGVTLYMAMGSNEYDWVVSSNREMAQQLESRNYQGFRFKFTEYGTQDHYSIVGPAIRNGLRWLFGLAPTKQ